MGENKVALVFTAKSVNRILAEGGTSSWRLDRNNARQCEFAVCTRNANADWVEGPEEHHAAFLVGKVKDVVPSPTYEGRYLIQFTEYAEVEIPDVWKGDRNPLRYATDLESLGIDPTELEWKKMPHKIKSKSIEESSGTVNSMTLDEAKKGLAKTFGVSPEAIEITIRG